MAGVCGWQREGAVASIARDLNGAAQSWMWKSDPVQYLCGFPHRPRYSTFNWPTILNDLHRFTSIYMLWYNDSNSRQIVADKDTWTYQIAWCAGSSFIQRRAPRRLWVGASSCSVDRPPGTSWELMVRFFDRDRDENIHLQDLEEACETLSHQPDH